MRYKKLGLLCFALFIAACFNLKDLTSLAEETPFRALGQASGNDPQKQYYRETEAGNYLSGQYAQRHQDWEKASEYMARLIALSPGNGNLKQKAMILAMGSGQHKRAFSLARQVMDDNSQNFWAGLFIAGEAMANRDYDNARKLIELKSDDRITQFIYPLLQIWLDAEKGILPDSIPTENSMYAYHVFLAADFLERGDAFMKDIDQAIEGEIFSAYDIENIADIHAARGRKERALELYRMIRESGMDSQLLGDKIALLEQGKPWEPYLSKRPIDSINGGLSRALFDVARILFREYNDESAQIFAQLALSLNASMTEARILLAHIQTRYGSIDNAIEHYRRVGRDDPNYIDVQNQIARLLNEQGKMDEAIAHLKTLIRDTGDVEAKVALADLYREDEQFEQAIPIYTELLSDAGNDLNIKTWRLYFARGVALEQTGDWINGKKDLEIALSYDRDNSYLLNYIGYSMADRGEDLPRALSMIRQAVDLAPDDGYIADSLGWVHYKMGNYELAIPDLERAVELVPYDPVINDHLGDAYWQVGRTLEARFQWERALNHAKDETLRQSLEDKMQNGLAAADQVPGGNAAIEKQAQGRVDPGTLNR